MLSLKMKKGVWGRARQAASGRGERPGTNWPTEPRKEHSPANTLTCSLVLGLLTSRTREYILRWFNLPSLWSFITAAGGNSDTACIYPENQQPGATWSFFY